MNSGARVLLVAEGACARREFEEALAREGHEVTVLPEVSEALGAIERSPFDLVLLDPGPSAEAAGGLVERLATADPDVSIVVFTDKPSLGSLRGSLLGGACEYVPKPLSSDGLSRLVRSVLERRGWTLRREGLSKSRTVLPGEVGSEAPTEETGVCWIGRSSEGPMTVGLSPEFLESLGPLLYVELPVEGDRIEAGEVAFRLLTANHRIHTIELPRGGRISRVNDTLLRAPGALSSGSRLNAWLMQFEEDGSAERGGAPEAVAASAGCPEQPARIPRRGVFGADPGRVPRVLVADDQAIAREAFRRVLSEDGFSVSTAVDGASALEQARSDQFDIAFLDLKMPGLDGLELARKLREADPTLQIVIVTGHGSAEAALEAARLGVSDFVSKPVAPDTLSALANAAWKQRARYLAHEGRPRMLWEESASPEREEPAPADPRGAETRAAVAELEPEAPPAPTVFGLIWGLVLGVSFVLFLPLLAFTKVAQLLALTIYRTSSSMLGKHSTWADGRPHKGGSS